MQFLQSYDWPGNVRQLKNCVEWMRVMNSNGRLGLSDLPVDLQPSLEAASGTTGRMNSLERAAILEALDQFGGNRLHASRGCWESLFGPCNAGFGDPDAAPPTQQAGKA